MARRSKIISLFFLFFFWPFWGGCQKRVSIQNCFAAMNGYAGNFVPLNDHLLVIATRQRVILWDLRSGKEKGRVETDTGMSAIVRAPDGFFTLSGSGRLYKFVVLDGAIQSHQVIRLEGEKYTEMAGDTQWNYLLGRSIAGEVSLFFLKEGQAKSVWTRHVCDSLVNTILSDESGGWYVGCERGNIVHLDSSGAVIAEMYMKGGMPVLSLAHVANGLIVAGMLDGTLFFVDRPLTKEIREVRELNNPIGILATDSTRNILAASDARGYTIVWNVTEWKQYGPFYEDGYDGAVIDPEDSTQLILDVRGRGLCRAKFL